MLHIPVKQVYTNNLEIESIDKPQNYTQNSTIARYLSGSSDLGFLWESPCFESAAESGS